MHRHSPDWPTDAAVPIPVAWGHYGVPFVYADSLGPGGATQSRYAAWMGRQLGQLPPGGVETECPPGWPQGVPCIIPTQLPGQATPPTLPVPGVPIVTEAEAARREKAAFDKGRREEQTAVIKTAAVSAAVSALVGIALGRWLGGR